MVVPAMKFRDVSRVFGSTEALARFDAEVPEGTITALLGRNGAGKTTAIRCAMGLLRPRSGRVEIFGHDSRDLPESVRATVGYVSERVTLDPRSTLEEAIELSRSCYPTWDDAYADELVRRLQLARNRAFETMSLGQSRKAALLLNLAFRPRLLVLDEPAGNLDAVVRREFLEAVLETFSDQGTTVLISTHLLHDVERLADRIILIENGKTRASATLDELHASVKGLRLPGAGSRIEQLAALEGVLVAKRFGEDVLLTVENFQAGAEARFATESTGAIDVVDLPLEDIFIAYGSSESDPGALRRSP